MTKLQSDDIKDLTLGADAPGESDFDEKSAKKLDSLNNRKVKIKRHRGLKVLIIFLLVLLLICGSIIGAFFTLKSMGKNEILKQAETISVPSIDGAEIISENKGYDIIYNGVKYTYNKNITSILFMGVDKRSLGTEQGTVGTGGQADSLYLAVIDMETGKMTTFGISRETMVDINLYSEKGKYMGTQNSQICLAYAYGDGKKTSCDNVIRSVQRLFYGVNINSYLALDLDGIKAINNSMGGVTVTLPDDLTIDGTAYSAGEQITLVDNMAESFVRTRSHTEIDANNSRMGRQKLYLDSFIKTAISKTKKDLSTPLDIYNVADDYTFTDMNASKVTYLASELLKKKVTNSNISFVPGTVIDGGEYAEFIVDQANFYQMFLDAYYTRVD